MIPSLVEYSLRWFSLFYYVLVGQLFCPQLTMESTFQLIRNRLNFLFLSYLHKKQKYNFNKLLSIFLSTKALTFVIFNNKETYNTFF